jgi:threonine/homoserine/homoserine lactone efflux protein
VEVVDWSIPFVGVLIGLAVAAPLGPVNLLVIRYALSHGSGAGLLAGLGAVAGDGLYAAVAAFGVSAVIEVLSAYSNWIELAGGIVLLAIGFKTARTVVDTASALSEPSRAPNAINLFATTFALTVSNPATLVAFLALFGSIGDYVTVTHARPVTSVALVASVMIGSLLWWTFVTAAVGRLRYRLSGSLLSHLNRWSGFAIALFGLIVFVRAVIDLAP